MEEDQDHIGMPRHCLEIDDDQQNSTANGSDSINASGDEGLSRSAGPTTELGHINPASLEPAPPACRQLPTSPLPQTIGKRNVKDTKPSGIGLHLNSLVNSVENAATISMKSKESGSVSIGSMSSSITRFPSSESSRSLPLSEVKSLKTLEQIPCDKTKNSTTNSTINEELIQSREKKIRFGNTSQQIDSQNPLAFSPKIIQPATEASTKSMEDGILSSSTRRRSVCNCKKTMCLKGKCMCFQASVGCSGGCSCVGCQNKYGLTKEYVNEWHLSKQDIHEVSSGGKLQEVASTDGTLYTLKFRTHELTPQTTSFRDEGLSRSAAPTAELGHINPTSLEPAPPASRQLPTSPLPQTIGKPNVKDTKPSGFGLHLNSLVNSVQNGAPISMKSEESGRITIRSTSSSTTRFLSSESSRSFPLSEYVNERHPSKQDISELYEVSSSGKLQEVASTDGTLCTQQLNTHELTPQTPLFQYSDHGKDRSKLQFPSERYLPSPESAKFADSCLIFPAPSENISSHGIAEDANKDILDPDPFRELGDGKLLTPNEFSPRYHGPGSMNDITSSMLWPSSSATMNLEEIYLGPTYSDYGLREALENDTPDILKDNVTPLDSGELHSPNKNDPEIDSKDKNRGPGHS